MISVLATSNPISALFFLPSLLPFVQVGGHLFPGKILTTMVWLLLIPYSFEDS